MSSVFGAERAPALRITWISFIAICLVALPASVGSAVLATASYHSVAGEFPTFFDATSAMPQAERVAAFKQRFNDLFPGFYEPAHDETQAKFDQSIADALDKFPKIRPQYEQAERDFPPAFNTALAHFRQAFPGFKPALPIWFVHSLGRMDGGSRTFGGKTYMIFGADVIAQIHNDGTMGPFLDHELFHMENGQWFKDCDPDTTIWCSLWLEGSAVYAASVMNPNATDHMLMLDLPRPIRAEVDAKWDEAVCQVIRDLDKGDDATYASYFYGGSKSQPYPHRWGYYIGYRMMQRIGRRYSLLEIDHFDNVTARRLMTKELRGMTKRECS
jgi:hypothetical protein